MISFAHNTPPPSTGDLVLVLLYNEGFHRFYYIGNCVKVVKRSYGPVLLLIRKKDRSRLRVPLCSPSLIGYRILRSRRRPIAKSTILTGRTPTLSSKDFPL